MKSDPLPQSNIAANGTDYRRTAGAGAHHLAWSARPTTSSAAAAADGRTAPSGGFAGSARGCGPCTRLAGNTAASSATSPRPAARRVVAQQHSDAPGNLGDAADGDDPRAGGRIPHPAAARSGGRRGGIAKWLTPAPMKTGRAAAARAGGGQRSPRSPRVTVTRTVGRRRRTVDLSYAPGAPSWSSIRVG